jgi:branched-subunit amino acid aminotransferase/4-amino-4-deoxychorismate lyase
MLLPITEAVMPLANLAYQYGFGVYENIKVRKGIIYFALQHIDRLFASAKAINLVHTVTKEQIVNAIEEVVKSNAIESCNIKLLLIGGEKKEDVLFFVLPLAPYFPQRRFFSQGVKVETTIYERFLPNAKTLDMLPSYMFYTQAKQKGCYDALLINYKGNILEGTRTNFFAIKGKTIFTPSKAHILQGVTKQIVLYVAKKHGYTIEEWDISLAQIKEGEYDGAFLTSTSASIVPIRKIDNFSFAEISFTITSLMKFTDTFLDASKGIFPEA